MSTKVRRATASAATTGVLAAVFDAMSRRLGRFHAPGQGR